MVDVQIIKIVDDLCELIEKQTAIAIRGDLIELGALTSDAENLIKKIAEIKLTDSAFLIEKKNKLCEMYRELSLIVTSRKNETFVELSKVRKNKKIIHAYYSNT